MKKRNLLIYGVVWALCLAVLNLAAFLFGNALTIFLFCAKTLRNGEVWHNRCMVDVVCLHFAQHLQSVA